MPRRVDEVRRIAASSYWREGDARVVVEAWRASGLSLSAFARRYGLSTRRVSRWAARLSDDPPSVRFHPVRVVERFGTSTSLGERAPIEIVVGDELRVRIPPGTDAAELRQVLEVVAEQLRC